MNSQRPDSRRSWAAGILIALLALCFATATQASVRMYTGSLIIKSFGNDTSTGASPPFDDPLAVGIPLTGQCNQAAYHAQETLTFPTTPLNGGPVTFTVPAYGGQVPTIDTNGDTLPDQVPGCGGTTIDSGDPLVGSGTINTTGSASTSRTSLNPRAFSIGASALNKVKTGASFEQYGVYLWEVHFADLHNDAAVFQKNGGDGNFGPILFNAAKEKRSVTQTAGKNSFGGVMRLLGSYGDNEGYFYNDATTSVYYFNWLFHYLGIGGQATKAGVVTGGFQKSYVNYGYTRSSGYPTTSTVYASLFKWTTGTVAVTALGGTFPTILERKGYDNRTAMGGGAIQMVSPMLTKWVGAGTSATAGIGIMKLDFVPEPSEWMMLAGGVSMLGLMVHKRRSNKRSSQD